MEKMILKLDEDSNKQFITLQDGQVVEKVEKEVIKTPEVVRLVGRRKDVKVVSKVNKVESKPIKEEPKEVKKEEPKEVPKEIKERIQDFTDDLMDDGKRNYSNRKKHKPKPKSKRR